MSLDLLYPQVTDAIERAEALDDAGALGVRGAYLDVSFLEEEIAAETLASVVEGMVARRGAIRAAIKAGALARASDLAERYGVEHGLPEQIAQEIGVMAAEALDALKLGDLANLRIHPTARFRFHDAA